MYIFVNEKSLSIWNDFLNKICWLRCSLQSKDTFSNCRWKTFLARRLAKVSFDIHLPWNLCSMINLLCWFIIDYNTNLYGFQYEKRFTKSLDASILQAKTKNVANHDGDPVRAKQSKRKKSRPPIGDLLFFGSPCWTRTSDILFVRRRAPAKWRVSLAGNCPHRASTNGKRRNHNVLPVRAQQEK